MKKIRVLIVEDSPVAQEFLTYILMSDPDIEVVGVAKNGSEALELVKELRPSVITMDIHMPIMDGFEATRRIMESVPTPIVVVSGSTGAQEVASTFRAMEAGHWPSSSVRRASTTPPSRPIRSGSSLPSS
jgi:two-component system chemotaxis response regulator CheB